MGQSSYKQVVRIGLEDVAASPCSMRGALGFPDSGESWEDAMNH